MRNKSRASLFVAAIALAAVFGMPSSAFASEQPAYLADADQGIDAVDSVLLDAAAGDYGQIADSVEPQRFDDAGVQAPAEPASASNEEAPYDSPDTAPSDLNATYEDASIDDADIASSSTANPAEESSESVSYRAHVENVGWQDWVQDGKVAGTSGQALRMEAVEFALSGAYDGEIFCQAHVQNIGWQRLGGTSVGENPAMVGTSGHALRVEAFKFTLAGEVSRYFDIVYRAHVESIGWQDWVQNGGLAGTSGQALRVEALQIKLVPKSVPTEESDGGPGLVYYTHVQNEGWQSQKASGETAGTNGQSLRMEAAVIYLDSAALDGSLEYRAHVQNIGWQDWATSGEMIGTSGQALRMEAFQIVLSGEIATRYDVAYRAHVQNVGWQPWAVNGAIAGTSGQALRMEALRITLIAKGVYEIPEGAYLISSADDVATIASAESPETLTTGSNCVGQEQKFYIHDVGGGFYSIQSVSNGTTLADVEGIIAQRAYSNGDYSQQWSATWNEGVILTNRATGKVLTIADGSVTSRPYDAQSAALLPALSDVQLIQDGIYLIKSADRGLVLDVEGASWHAGANVFVFTPNGGGNQAFKISLSDSDAYLITCAMTGKALDVASGSTANGANIRQWWPNGAGAQLWKATLDFDGAFRFVNVTSGHHLASEGDGSAGSNVVSSDLTQAANRKWILEPTSYEHDSVLACAIDIAQHEGSYTDYLILVDLTNNRTVVFEWSNGEWEPIFNWVCSTGAPWSPTVLGDYEVTGKGYSFNGALGGEPYTCYYYTQFYGDYLFHSIPYHQGTWNVQDATLGESVSHGCVRLATENAKWLYDNIPYHTHVLTYY